MAPFFVIHIRTDKRIVTLSYNCLTKFMQSYKEGRDFVGTDVVTRARFSDLEITEIAGTTVQYAYEWLRTNFYKVFKEVLSRFLEGVSPLDIIVTGDFQCDQTGGAPTALNVCWEKGIAWLSLSESICEDDEFRALFEQQCAEFGIRRCIRVAEFNAICKRLGNDAVSIAPLPEYED